MAHPSQASRRALTIALLLACAIVIAPYGGIVVLAVWFAQLARPLMERAVRLLGGRRRAGAALTLAVVVVLLLPVAVLSIVATSTALDIVGRLQESRTGLAVLEAVRAALRDGAVRAAQTVGAGATRVLIGASLFILGAYSCLVDGERAWKFLRDRAPLPPALMDRLAEATHETGRGLLIGVCLTALTQSVVATVVYLALGIPHALVLGALTFVAAFVPFVGTSTVWVPTAIGLAIGGRPAASAALAVLGVVLIGTVDNVMRAFFAHRARLALPVWVVALTMFGGLAVLGFQGLWLGPLIARLALEVSAPDLEPS